MVAAGRLWTLAAVGLWLAYHSKMAAVFIVPAITLTALVERRRLDRQALAFVGTAILLFGFSTLWVYVFAADPIEPYHAELSAQGLVGAGAIEHAVTSSEIFRLYPRWLFYPDGLGHLLYSVHPHLLVLLILLGPLLRLRSSLAVALWLAFVLLGMELNVQRVDGVWVAGFRNIRHAHVFVYPIVLLLTGYLVSLRARLPRLGTVVIAGVLAVSAWQSVATAWVTHVAFGDRRRAGEFLAGLPRKTIYSDFQIGTWLVILGLDPPMPAQVLHPFDRNVRRTEIARSAPDIS